MEKGKTKVLATPFEIHLYPYLCTGQINTCSSRVVFMILPNLFLGILDENTYGLKAVDYVHQKSQLQIFGRVQRRLC